MRSGFRILACDPVCAIIGSTRWSCTGSERFILWKQRNLSFAEELKNGVAAGSLVFAAGWGVFQWNTIFPGTAADVTIFAANLRARTQGSLGVNSVALPDGSRASPPKWSRDRFIGSLP